MKRTALTIFALATFCFLSVEANAKRIRIPIFIPGLGSSEVIELVKDLPNIEALRRDDGKYVDLGYLHKRGGGEWIGYIGSDSTYVILDPEGLKFLLQVSGLKELPPAPASKYGELGWFKFVLIPFGILMFLVPLMKFFRRFRQRVEAGRTAGFEPVSSQPAFAFQPSQQRPMFGQASQPNTFGRR
jgi:hypothetical protein